MSDARASSHARGQLLRSIDKNSPQPYQLSEAMVIYIRDLLCRNEFGITFQNALLPRDLVQILIVKHAADPGPVRPFAPILRNRNQLRHVAHLHGAVTYQSNNRPVGMSDLAAIA